jgi:hypothetical protein
VARTGSRPTNFGDEAVLQQILRRDLAEDFAGAAVFRRDYLSAEADRARPVARRDDLLEPGEGTAECKAVAGAPELIPLCDCDEHWLGRRYFSFQS